MTTRLTAVLVVSVLLGLLAAARTHAGPAPGWKTLEPGLELGEFRLPEASFLGDSTLHVVRVDPQMWDLRLLNASAPGNGRPLTAKAWAQREALVAAINPAMYRADHRTSTGLMRTPGHVNNPKLNADQSLLAFDPLVADVPRVKIIDRECDDFETWSRRYGSLAQSIRMLSCKGRNVWSQGPRKWSAAAIGTDRAGRVLLLHVRSPYSMHDLVENLRRLPLDLERALYGEGGPEAQLYVRAGGEEHEFVGSFETGFNENADNDHAWPVPNVIGVVPRTARGERTGAPLPDDPPPAGGSAVQARIDADLRAGKPLLAHVVVALCDNEHQGIVPVPAALGDGQDPRSNLYWGAMYGVKTFLARGAGWRPAGALPAPAPPVLDRVVLRSTVQRSGRPVEAYVVAEAWDGRAMRGAIERFLALASGRNPETLQLAGPGAAPPLAACGAAHLVAFVGHNGLMDFRLAAAPDPAPGAPPRSSAVLACASKSHFLDPLRGGGSHPLLLTNGLMAPEAYSLDALVRAWFAGESAAGVRDAAAAAYARHQRCGREAARNLFWAGP